MREQLTTEAIALLWTALIIFWGTVAVLIRRHARQRGAVPDGTGGATRQLRP